MSQSDTRQRIIEVADQLFYEHGYEHTSFARVADEIGISRGNFYYHFQSKDDILEAVIERRLRITSDMLEQWTTEGITPIDRLKSFVRILAVNNVNIRRYGCPVGTLSTELSKLSHPAQPQAKSLFLLFRSWLRKQFKELGLGASADSLAMHLLALSQGVATIANAFHDKAFIDREVRRIEQWLDTVISSNPEKLECL